MGARPRAELEARQVPARCAKHHALLFVRHDPGHFLIPYEVGSQKVRTDQQNGDARFRESDFDFIVLSCSDTNLSVGPNVHDISALEKGQVHCQRIEPGSVPMAVTHEKLSPARCLGTLAKLFGLFVEARFGILV